MEWWRGLDTNAVIHDESKDAHMLNFQGEPLPETLSAIRTRPLFVMKLSSRPMLVLGAAVGTYRRVAVVFGGTFEGERLQGEVLDGGSDWQTVNSAGAVKLDVRLVLRTRDGELIGMTYQGFRNGAPDVLARIDKGEVVDPAQYYFRTNPLFETHSAKYEWLNHIITVGVGFRRADGPVYSVFEVL
jgi:hypothetical protein